jgi:uncharacterized membrane protein YgcG
VAKPFAILFTLNFIFLVAWTAADPLRWLRVPVPNQPWNTYGTCASTGPVGTSMMFLIVIINMTALLLAGWQAYKARNIDSEFSEAKWLAIGIFSWVQVVIVGVPVLFLIANDNPTARYFLLCALLFAVCMSMMCLIYIPIILAQWRKPVTSNVRVSGLASPSVVSKWRTQNTESGTGTSNRGSGFSQGDDSFSHSELQEQSMRKLPDIEETQEQSASELPDVEEPKVYMEE